MSARRWKMGAIACAATSVVGVVLAGGVAKAVPAPEPRFVEGNVTTCAEAGLSGEIIIQGEGDAASDAGSGDVSADGLFLDVTINAGWTASGVAVKGGPDTFVYDGPFVGPITVEDMRAPDNMGGQQPQISHWLVCGTRTVPTNGPTTPTVTPSGPARTGGGGSLADSGWLMGGGAIFAAAALAGALAWRRRNDNA